MSDIWAVIPVKEFDGAKHRLSGLLSPPQRKLLAETMLTDMLDAVEAERIGLVDKVLPRSSFDDHWRGIARALASRPAGEIKRVMKGTTTTEAVTAFARLWVADEHWAAADKVMKK